MAPVLRAAAPDDIAFIMACERRPGYAAHVGQWPGDRHAAAMADPAFGYFIGEDGKVAIGFAITFVQPMRPQNLYLKRIAVHDADRGHGRLLLSALNDWVFANTDTHRFWLEAVEGNVRAIRLYERLGFVVEGIVREGFLAADGARGNFVQMSLVKPDWLARAR